MRINEPKELGRNLYPEQLQANNQRADIISSLNKNPNNYWINTAGFEALIDSFI